jgi:hypothetical protein
MLSEDSLNQSLTNTRRVHVDCDAFGVVEKGLDSLMTGLRVQVTASDAPVTVSIRKLHVLPNTDIQVLSTKFLEDTTGKKNHRFFHTNHQVKKLKQCFSHEFGYGSQSLLPPTSITKQSTIKLVQESRMLNNNIMLNSILNVPSDDILDE